MSQSRLMESIWGGKRFGRKVAALQVRGRRRVDRRSDFMKMCPVAGERALSSCFICASGGL